jgi:hypothetical protein
MLSVYGHFCKCLPIYLVTWLATMSVSNRLTPPEPATTAVPAGAWDPQAHPLIL